MDTVGGGVAAAHMSGPLIVGGMHRSGTSLLAALLAGAGLHLGDDLLEASAGNRRGHFEDVGILTFHRNVLLANGLLSEGYTTQDRMVIPERLRRQADGLVADRRRPGRAWGWKDPRTTLFLDYWAGVLPDARYLLVFRRPWEVVDSLLRRNEATFHWNPAFAIDVWSHYNRKVLDFAKRHADVTFVCEVTQFTEEPGQFFDGLRRRLSLPVGEPPARYESGLLHQDSSSTRPALLAAACPRAYDLYLELRDLAGSRSPLPEFGQTADAVDLQEHVFEAWGLATHHMLRCEQAEQRLTGRRSRATLARRGWRGWLGLVRERPKAA